MSSPLRTSWPGLEKGPPQRKRQVWGPPLAVPPGEGICPAQSCGFFPLCLSLVIVTMAGQEKAIHSRAPFAGELDSSKKHVGKISWWGERPSRG